jgi:hypothetical protein
MAACLSIPTFVDFGDHFCFKRGVSILFGCEKKLIFFHVACFCFWLSRELLDSWLATDSSLLLQVVLLLDDD